MSLSMKKNEITIILDRLRSAYNTGNIFRIAEAIGAKEIIACGYTPYPPHPKLAKTAMQADEMVPCRHFDTSYEAVKQLREEGISQVLAVETVEDATNVWDMEYEFPLAIILGNEALGISEETLAVCDGYVSLPMLGKKASINVGNCAAVVCYSILEYIEKRDITNE
jgi:tRNA G18 (ribose-2'-O)-methylase SpoU